MSQQPTAESPNSAHVSTSRVLTGGCGPDWVEASSAVPGPGPGQVRIRVEAASLNRVDLQMLEGSYNNAVQGAGSYTAGRECAGIVDAVGDGVDPALLSSPVMAAAAGSFADHVLVDARNAMPVPAGLSWAEASSLPVGLGTEHDALVQTGFKPGRSVLILGATSSIGLLGVQLAKAMGASGVIATTTSNSKAQVLYDLGADAVVNTRNPQITEKILELTEDGGVEIVLDHLGGEPLANTLPAMAIGGTLISIGRLAGRESTLSMDTVAFRRLRIIGTTFSVRNADERAVVYDRLRADVIEHISAGRVSTVIDRIVPFARAQEAADALRSGGAIGKIVLDVNGRADNQAAAGH